jgi:hypothetical protein
MARYIDADKIDYKFIMVGQDEYAGYREIAFEIDIDELPTADVVPKSEYDLAVAEREANVKGFTEELAKAKAEVERLRAKIKILTVPEDFAELEKKYTEGIDDESTNT